MKLGNSKVGWKGADEMLFLIWIVFALVSGSIASSKGRSAFIHFLMALILSPLWILVPLLAEGFKDCPKCNRKMKDSIRICECGYEFKY
jgi:pheromone shutdown protein TraB